jgi:hypothetical protein
MATLVFKHELRRRIPEVATGEASPANWCGWWKGGGVLMLACVCAQPGGVGMKMVCVCSRAAVCCDAPCV